MSQRTDNNGGVIVGDNDDLWRRRAALGAMGTAFAGSLLLIAPFVAMQLRSPLPYMSTPRRKVVKALEEIAARRGGGGGRTSTTTKKGAAAERHPGRRQLRFCDLGSGDGEAVLAAAGAGWHAAGIELNPTLWAVSCARRLMSPRDVRRNSRFVLGDMWSSSLRGAPSNLVGSADAIMIFGVAPLMPRIAEKISAECRPGTHVLSYRFRVPIQEDPGDGCGALRAKLIYDDEEMRVYEVLSKRDEDES